MPIHPKIVHFPVALIITSLVFLLLAFVIKSKGEIFKEVFKWNLYLGTISAIAALISGLQEEKTLVHNNAIHELMQIHEKLGYIVAAILICLSLWFILRKSKLKAFETGIFVAFLTSIVIILGFTAHIGGRMVYEHGAGVIPMEEQIMDSQNNTDNAKHIYDHTH